MKLKKILTPTALLLVSTSLFAKNKLADSVGVENLDGKKVILHKLDPKDNYYSVGRRYNVRPGDIIKFNNNAPLKIGAIIKVPTERPFLEPSRPAVVQQTKPVVTQPAVVQQTKPAVTQQPEQKPVVSSEATTQQYKVSAGETLYSIAKRFNSTVEDITRLNNLSSTTVTPGEILQVRSNTANTPPPAPTPAPTTVEVVRPVAKRDSPNNLMTSQDSADRKFNSNRFGLYEKNEKGVATWIDDTSLDPSKRLVLHHSAPIGTVIKITNPMSGKTTFAKVVGRISDNENTKDVILVMTKNVAESIGALDKRTRVSITYGSPNE